MRPQASALLSFLAFALLATGLAAEQPKLEVTRIAVVLTTRTPLGDARIELPAGTPLDSTQVTEGRIFINKPPFSGWIPVADTSLGGDAKTQASPIPPKEEPSPKVESLHPLEKTSGATSIQGSLLGEPSAKWLIEGHLFPALCVITFLACGSILVSLACFLLLKNRYLQAKLTPRPDAEKALEARFSKEIQALQDQLAKEHAIGKANAEVLSERDKLRKELAGIREQDAQLSKNLDKATAKNRELESLTSAQKSEITSLEEQLRAAETKNKALGESAKDHDKLTKELAVTREQNAQLSKNLDQTTATNRELESLVARLKTEFTSLGEQLRNAETKNKALGESVKDHEMLTKELAVTREQNAQLSKNLDQATAKNRELESLTSAQKAEISSQGETLRAAESRIQELSAQIPSPDVPCPLCGKPISRASLHVGPNTCPSCKQDFNCE